MNCYENGMRAKRQAFISNRELCVPLVRHISPFVTLFFQVLASVFVAQLRVHRK